MFSSGKHSLGFPLGQEEGGVVFGLKLDEYPELLRRGGKST